MFLNIILKLFRYSKVASPSKNSEILSFIFIYSLKFYFLKVIEIYVA